MSVKSIQMGITPKTFTHTYMEYFNNYVYCLCNTLGQLYVTHVVRLCMYEHK